MIVEIWVTLLHHYLMVETERRSLRTGDQRLNHAINKSFRLGCALLLFNIILNVF